MVDVLALLDRLDNYLAECSRLPLVGKLMVDEEEIFTLIDDLRAAIPQELEQAKWLLKERERILQEARKEAEEIIKDAQGQIASLASESVITKEAKLQAEELIEKAKEVAREINLGSREYADEIMKKVESVLEEMLERVREGRKELGVEKAPDVKESTGQVAAGLSSDREEEVDEEELEEDDEEQGYEDKDIVSQPKVKRRRVRPRG